MHYTPLVIAVFASVLVSILFSFYKSGYHVDEVWTYGLSNSYHKPFLDGNGRDDDSIHMSSGDEYTKYLTTDSSDRFKFESVVYNQERDVHPPLFYFVIHLISSIFPGEFNKWIGIVPNLLYLVITLIFIYLITQKLTSNKLLPVISTLLYGLSVDAVDTSTYIRMYMMMTMFVTIFSYLHIRLVVDKTYNTKLLIALSLTTFLGIFTQYYFIIFAAVVGILTFIYLLISKQFNRLWKYCLSMLSALVAMLLIYPTAYKTMLGINELQLGYNHAQYAMSTLGSSDNSLIQFVYFVNMEVFGGMLKPLIIILLVILLVVVTKGLFTIKFNSQSISIKLAPKLSDSITIHNNVIIATLLFTATIAYIAVVSKISNLKEDRYIFCIYPIVVIISVLLIYRIVRLVTANKIASIVTIVVTLVLLIGQYAWFLPIGRYPDTLYTSDKPLNKYMEANRGKPCIYIYDKGGEWGEQADAVWLRQCSTVYKVPAKKAVSESAKIIKDNKPDITSYTIFIGSDADSNAILKNIKDVNKTKDIKHIHHITAANHWGDQSTCPTCIT